LTHPQRPDTCLQRGGVEVTLRAREMIVALGLRDLLSRSHRTAVEVHQAPVRRGVRTGARPRIAYTVLLRQGKGNAPLLQVHCPATAGQGGLERRELLGKVG